MWNRRILGAGGALLGSVLLVKEEKPTWRVEYPKFLNENGERLSRKIINEQDKTNLDLRLYQYQSCPYCCKVSI